MITDKMYYKMIDNLPYSIKPKNYDEFRRNLTKCLKRKLFPGNPKTLYEMLVECNMKQLRNMGVKVSMEMVSEHTIMEICMMYIQDDFEFDMRVPQGCPNKDEYIYVFMEPLMKKGNFSIHHYYC